MDRETFQTHKALLYDEPIPLEVAVDLSVAGVSAAWSQSFERSGGCEPNLLLVASGDYHLAEKIVSGLPLTMRCIAVIPASWLDPDAWLIGNIHSPAFWVGSEGA